jgi:hypothetical protein
MPPSKQEEPYQINPEKWTIQEIISCLNQVIKIVEKEPMQEKWAEEFDKIFSRRNEQTGNFEDNWFVQDYVTAKEFKNFIRDLQKETDDKWKKRVEEACREIEKEVKEVVVYEENMSEKQRGESIFNCGFNDALDQATNIIKELVK